MTTQPASIIKPASTIENDRAHYDELRGRKEDQWSIKYLYDRLNIIDSKTSSLLRFNGVMLGFVAVLALRIIESDQLVLRPHPAIYLTGCCAVLATLAFAEWHAFRIFALEFDRIADGRTFDDYKDAFFQITCDRETRYRSALNASQIGGALFIVLVFALILQSNRFWSWCFG